MQFKPKRSLFSHPVANFTLLVVGMASLCLSMYCWGVNNGRLPWLTSAETSLLVCRESDDRFVDCSPTPLILPTAAACRQARSSARWAVIAWETLHKDTEEVTLSCIPSKDVPKPEIYPKTKSVGQQT